MLQRPDHRDPLPLEKTADAHRTHARPAFINRQTKTPKAADIAPASADAATASGGAVRTRNLIENIVDGIGQNLRELILQHDIRTEILTAKKMIRSLFQHCLRNQADNLTSGDLYACALAFCRIAS